ncbi:MAG TPA: hypothetical protein PLO59_06070, partial [Bacteroidia bacterium]|nr:hypothetical protein [Bacteroidia bacterium]
CLIVSLFIGVGCSKTNLSETPEIAIESISPSSAKAYTDSITIIMSYKDGNGDLGENHADAKNLFVTDSRNGLVYPFRLQQLAPANAQVPIQGKVNIVLPRMGLTDSSNAQTFYFSVYVHDRALNKSNVVQTPLVTLLK